MAEPSRTRTYDPRQSVVFRVTADRFGGLSNMAPNFPLKVNGTSIRSAEALYQACRFPHLPEVQLAIIDERSPMTAKMRAKHFLTETRADWERVRVRVMRWCIHVKLAQNWDRFGLLLATTDEKPIVEESIKDAFWGAKPGPSGELVGVNALGRLLMELRQQFRDPDHDTLKIVQPLKIPSFLLLGRSIGTIDAAQAREATTPERRSATVQGQHGL